MVTVAIVLNVVFAGFCLSGLTGAPIFAFQVCIFGVVVGIFNVITIISISFRLQKVLVEHEVAEEQAKLDALKKDKES